MLKRVVTCLTLVTAALVTVPGAERAGAEPGRPNVVILMSDDQRWDKITPEYTPNIWDLAHQPGSTFFRNSFVSNPLCCPSRTTVLTGRYSHSTGVWDNGDYAGGFGAFDDTSTLATDFQAQGYRTALVGKYLNGYRAGRDTYVPPGWDTWYAINTGAYYDYEATTNAGTARFGDEPRAYSTRVLKNRAVRFITDPSATEPFFMYLAFSAPHGPAIPDVRDVGRFAGEEDFDWGRPDSDRSALESAYSVDRAVGQVLDTLPPDTVVLYMSDNGFQWNDETPRGFLSGKLWPYNESIRVPMVFHVPEGMRPIVAAEDDIVANVDLRISLTHVAGITSGPQEGIDWFDPGYVPRDHLLIEHYAVPTYCGVRQSDWMYARFKEADGTYTEELYHLGSPAGPIDPLELTNLASTDDEKRLELRASAEAECDPAPPGYEWAP